MNYNKKSLSLQSVIYLLRGFFLILIFTQCTSVNESFDENSTTNPSTPEEKQKGAHLFGKIDSNNLQPLVNNNYNWITLVSWSDQEDIDSPHLAYYRGDSIEMARRDSMWKNQIDLAHDAGFKVFFKPHVWISKPSDGKWRSDIFPTNEANWEQWKSDYREFILYYANIAQKNKVELFCIGTELSRLTTEKADFWKTIIKEVRSIYTGKITYAANWYREYEKISFWKDLDYIGIQAYFPLVKNEYPTVEQISKGWNKYIGTIESISKKYNRTVLFTEMGYKSTADSAVEPWLWIEKSPEKDKTLSIETQANCYQAFFDTIWKKEWFTGVHIWQLRSDYIKGRGYSDMDFTPQGKPAEQIIAKGFK